MLTELDSKPVRFGRYQDCINLFERPAKSVSGQPRIKCNSFNMPTMDFAKLERIDVHCHAITPKYREFLLQSGHENPDGMPSIPVS